MASFKVVLAEHGYSDIHYERDIIQAAGGELIDCDGLPSSKCSKLPKPPTASWFVACSSTHPPPGSASYSIDKYFSRTEVPFDFHSKLYEIRLLTVVKEFRSREVATLLMYAAFRWVESHGGTHIVAIGRREVLEMYLKVGLQRTGHTVQSGFVTYDLLHASTAEIRRASENFNGLLCRIEQKTLWQISFAFRRPARCFHGGAFFSAVGERFDDLRRRERIISADVLDAWFPPSPRVMDSLAPHWDWLIRTSPPTACEGLVQTIAEARDVSCENILPGAGSSDLIFRAFLAWLTPRSHVLLLDPTYGEYVHVLERVIGCTVDRLSLDPASHYDVDLDRLRAALHDEYDLIVLVNPNSPTGRHIPRCQLQPLLRSCPHGTRVWVDETYVDYVNANASLETFAVESENVLVCKSMSKVYALSGMRAAYLCAAPHQLEALRAVTPPWVVGLPSQVAATAALQDPVYYQQRYTETRSLRSELARQLEALGWTIVPGVANFLLCHLPPSSSAEDVVTRCRTKGLYVRNAALMGARIGEDAIRIAVKDEQTNKRILAILRECMV